MPDISMVSSAYSSAQTHRKANPDSATLKYRNKTMTTQTTMNTSKKSFFKVKKVSQILPRETSNQQSKDSIARDTRSKFCINDNIGYLHSNKKVK